VWFDASVSDGADRIDELERGFRRDGLPNLVVDYSVAEDVFTRALPFLALVFAVEVVVAIDAEFGWTGIGLVAAVMASVAVAFGITNEIRGQRFFSIPKRVGAPELTAFVIVPTLVSFLFGDRRLDALVVLACNLVIVAGTYVVVGFRVLSIVRWAGVRFFTQLRATLPVLVRAVPLLLFFSLVMFFTTEIWQVFSLSPEALFWTAIALFMVLGIVFLSVRLPGVINEVASDAEVGDPLRQRERRNLEVVALISEGLQVLFVSAAVWLFYVVIGSLLVTEQIRALWFTAGGDAGWTLSLFGEQLQIGPPLLRVATGVASFAGLYYAVAILVDSAYRDQFVDTLTGQLRDTFARRAEYLQLIHRRDELRPDDSSNGTRP
jgi:hypothetical protein